MENRPDLKNVMEISSLRTHLLQGQVIPALPLALDANRQWSRRHQRALVRYYFEAGAGGLAVAVHSTQFEIRQPEHALFEPILELAADESKKLSKKHQRPFPLIAGICGRTDQALKEAGTAHALGYAAGLLSLAAWKNEPIGTIIDHCREVAGVIPLVGFYLQPAVGGCLLSYAFWKEFVRIPNVVAIKMAPFNRYQTLDVVRAVLESGREDVALYTGNDDNIILDLLTPWEFAGHRRFMAGGLLGQFGVWTQKAVALLEEIKQARVQSHPGIGWLAKNTALTDANAAIFDATHGFHGCLPGIHEVLRRQGLLPTTHCLNPAEVLSAGQAEEITRVSVAYPWLRDDEFVASRLGDWLAE
jgi:dihydrodipicolinate synthase/N-acetylneuraminate lyase